MADLQREGRQIHRYRSRIVKLTPNPERVANAAAYIENGKGGSQWIAYVLSMEILRLAAIASCDDIALSATRRNDAS